MDEHRIAHITTIDWFFRYLLVNQLVALRETGYNVTGISKRGGYSDYLNEKGIRHINLQFTRNFTPFKDLATLLRLYRILRRERFALIHTHTPKPGLLGQIAAWMARVPVIVNTIHGYYFHENMTGFWRRFYITVEKIAAHFSSLVFFVSEEDMLTASREGICPPEKMRRLGPGGIGVDIQRFNRRNISQSTLETKRTELGILPETKVVGFVGRLVEEKGINELLEAASIVHRQIPNLRILLVGPIDDEKPDVVKPEKAREYGVEDICIFLGNRSDVPELMALMDIFVLPSYREGFPVVLMEASSMSVPCITTDVRGCREVVVNNRNGIVVPLKNVQALSSAIVEVLTDDNLAQKLGGNGRLIAETRFDERIMFQNLKTEYARLLREKGVTIPTPHKANNAHLA